MSSFRVGTRAKTKHLARIAFWRTLELGLIGCSLRRTGPSLFGSQSPEAKFSNQKSRSRFESRTARQLLVLLSWVQISVLLTCLVDYVNTSMRLQSIQPIQVGSKKVGLSILNRWLSPRRRPAVDRVGPKSNKYPFLKFMFGWFTTLLRFLAQVMLGTGCTEVGNAPSN